MRYLFFLILIVCSPAHSKANKLILGAPETRPMAYSNENNEPSGMLIDIAAFYADHLNLELEVVFCHYLRCQRLAEMGKVDMMIGLIRNADREQVFHFIEPRLTRSKEQLMFFSQPGLSLSMLSDLSRQAIGRVRGLALPSSLIDTLDSSEISVFEVGSIDQLIDMLMAERIQAFIYSESGGRVAVNQRELGEQIKPYKVDEIETIEGFLAVSKSSALIHQTDKLSQFTAQLIKNDKIPGIYRKYGLHAMAEGLKNNQ